MRYGAVDIGTNSMRLLIADVSDGEVSWVDRRVAVTGLGKGVDTSGRLAEEAMERTLAVLAGYGVALAEADVVAARATATSAARDAANRDEFLDRAGRALGFRPELISGTQEAELSFRGATHAFEAGSPFMVIDIGGGSTEFVFGGEAPDYRLSIDIGSVRLTDRVLGQRPAPEEELAAARDEVARELEGLTIKSTPATVIGVAGTFTSLSAISQDLPVYDPGRVHMSRLSLTRIAELVLYLAALTVEETAAIPALDPARAPVILAGAVIAEAAVRLSGRDEIVVSESDSLDGVVLELASQPG